MRHPVYCWGDGESVHMWARQDSEAKAFHPDGAPDPAEEDCDYPGFTGGLSMPYEVFDSLAIYRVFELLQEGEDAWRRAVLNARKGAGNFGTYAFFEAMGEDPRAELEARMEAIKSNRKATP